MKEADVKGEKDEVEKKEEGKKPLVRGEDTLAGWSGGQYFGRRQTQLCNLLTGKYFVPKGIIIPLFYTPSPHSRGLGAGGGAEGNFLTHPPLQKIWPAGVGRGIYGG
jgi:hypothetical protein